MVRILAVRSYELLAGFFSIKFFIFFYFLSICIVSMHCRLIISAEACVEEKFLWKTPAHGKYGANPPFYAFPRIYPPMYSTSADATASKETGTNHDQWGRKKKKRKKEKNVVHTRGCRIQSFDPRGHGARRAVGHTYAYALLSSKYHKSKSFFTAGKVVVMICHVVVKSVSRTYSLQGSFAFEKTLALSVSDGG